MFPLFPLSFCLPPSLDEALLLSAPSPNENLLLSALYPDMTAPVCPPPPRLTETLLMPAPLPRILWTLLLSTFLILSKKIP